MNNFLVLTPLILSWLPTSILDEKDRSGKSHLTNIMFYGSGDSAAHAWKNLLASQPRACLPCQVIMVMNILWLFMKNSSVLFIVALLWGEFEAATNIRYADGRGSSHQQQVTIFIMISKNVIHNKIWFTIKMWFTIIKTITLTVTAIQFIYQVSCYMYKDVNIVIIIVVVNIIIFFITRCRATRTRMWTTGGSSRGQTGRTSLSRWSPCQMTNGTLTNATMIVILTVFDW